MMSRQRIIAIKVDGDADIEAIGRAISVASPSASEPLDATEVFAVISQLANIETWVERNARQAIEEYGLETAAEIGDHIHAAQTDTDYLCAQDETLERLIAGARRARGTLRDQESVIDQAMRDARVGPYAQARVQDDEPGNGP